MIFKTIEPKKNCKPSLSFLGFSIAKSYLNVDNALNMLPIATIKAAEPKTNGEYILDMNGIETISTICETKVPDDRVAISFI